MFVSKTSGGEVDKDGTRMFFFNETEIIFWEK